VPGQKEGVNADLEEPHSRPSPRQSHLRGREVGDGDLEGLQDGHGAGGLLIQHLPRARLQQMRLHRRLGHRHTDLWDSLLSPRQPGTHPPAPSHAVPGTHPGTEVVDGLSWEASPAQGCQREEPRVIPVPEKTPVWQAACPGRDPPRLPAPLLPHGARLHQPDDLPLGDDGVEQVQAPVLPLHGAVDIQRVAQPEVGGAPAREAQPGSPSRPPAAPRTRCPPALRQTPGRGQLLPPRAALPGPAQPWAVPALTWPGTLWCRGSA